MATQHHEVRLSGLSKASHTHACPTRMDGATLDVPAESYLAYLEEFHSELLDSASSPASDNSIPEMFGYQSMDSTSEDDGSCASTVDSLKLSGRSFTGRLNAMWNPVHMEDDGLALSRRVEASPGVFTADPPSADICKALLSCAQPGMEGGILGVTCDVVVAPRAEAPVMGEEQPRRVHNALERERRGNLRRCFERLRTVLPQLRDNRAHSLQILHEATTLIAGLQSEAAALEAGKAQLLQQNAALVARVAQLRGQLKPIG